MKNKANKILVVIFLAIIFSSLLSYIVIRPREFSENENRYLAQRPKFSFENLLSGKFTADMEKYIDDQFPLRNSSISFKSRLQRKLGKKDINGVYLGNQGYLIEKVLEQDFDYGGLQANIDAINSFTENRPDLDVKLLVAPTSGLILKDKLPKNATIFNQNKAFNMIEDQMEDLSFIDLREVLEKHKDEYIYYKTDHHWTSLGALYGYQAYMEKLGKTPVYGEDDLKTVSEDFKGTLYSKVLDKSIEEDQVNILDLKDIDYKVKYNFDKEESKSIYNLEELEKKDKYAVFLGGNHPELKIESETGSPENILILKDSFANAFLPFLVGEYKNIHLVDLRYFKKDLNQYIEENQIEKVLFFYNIQNLANEKNIIKINK